MPVRRMRVLRVRVRRVRVWLVRVGRRRLRLRQGLELASFTGVVFKRSPLDWRCDRGWAEAVAPHGALAEFSFRKQRTRRFLFSSGRCGLPLFFLSLYLFFSGILNTAQTTLSPTCKINGIHISNLTGSTIRVNELTLAAKININIIRMAAARRRLLWSAK